MHKDITKTKTKIGGTGKILQIEIGIITKIRLKGLSKDIITMDKCLGANVVWHAF